MKGLIFKIKALKQQAVFRFASAYNTKQHDEAREKIHHRTQTNL